MAGPWEKYQEASPAPSKEEGPWSKYQPERPNEDQRTEGLGSKLLGLAVAGAKKFDSYTGAPTRAAISAAQDARNPVAAFSQQFGQDPDQAPTGEDIVKKAGVPEGIPSKVAGFGMDMAANPLNFTGPIAASLGKALNASREIPYAGAAIGAVADFPGRVATKVMSKVTPLPEKAVDIYARNPNVVNDFIHGTGGEVSAGADAMKDKIMNSIRATKEEQNAHITQVLSDPRAPLVDTAPILEKLQSAKDAINPHIPSQAASLPQIDEMTQMVKSIAPDGAINLKNLYEIKKEFQLIGSGGYVKNGEIFTPAESAVKAAMDAGKISADSLHKASPQIAHADAIFSDLHNLDNKMSVALLGTGKAEDVFASAGGATSKYANQHYTALKKIGELTGTNPVQDAETVYAAKALNKSPSLRKEAFKTLETIKQGVSESSAPERAYNAVQALGVPDSPMQQKKKSTAIERRLGSHGK